MMTNGKPRAYQYIDSLPQKKRRTNKNKTNIIMPRQRNTMSNLMQAARPIIGNVPRGTAILRFKSFFGVTVEVCTILFLNLLAKFEAVTLEDDRKFLRRFSEKHLLWALFFLKVYSTERVAASMLDTTEKTYRKWSHALIEEIAKLLNSMVSKQK
jgi:hypothetical protein